MRTANPALNDKTFAQTDIVMPGEDRMTLQGTVNKTAILLLLVLGPAVWIWSQMFDAQAWETFNPGIPIAAGCFLGLILGFVTALKRTWAPVTAPLYALAQGFFVGGLSALLESVYPGIVLQAVVLTFGTMICLLFVYKSGFLKVTDNFKMGVVSATGAIALIYLVTAVMRVFGIQMPFLHDGSTIGIVFSLFVVGVAAFNLVLDFDFIERGAEQGAPRYMEWYASFGLLVTLLWLYIEVLRLLAKMRSRR